MSLIDGLYWENQERLEKEREEWKRKTENLARDCFSVRLLCIRDCSLRIDYGENMIVEKGDCLKAVIEKEGVRFMITPEDEEEEEYYSFPFDIADIASDFYIATDLLDDM